MNIIEGSGWIQNITVVYGWFKNMPEAYQIYYKMHCTFRQGKGIFIFKRVVPKGLDHKLSVITISLYVCVHFGGPYGQGVKTTFSKIGAK